MNVHHREAVIDFDTTLRQAQLGYLFARLTRQSGTLRSWQDDCRQLVVTGQYDRGIEQVPVDRIVGSTERRRDFDRQFRPLCGNAIQRWLRVARAHSEGLALSPIKVYKLGDAYYVQDGHHRVSVARVRGQVVIDAYVVEALVSASPSFHGAPAWTGPVRRWAQLHVGRHQGNARTS